MYVCVCHSLTDREIHEAVGRGARTLDDLQGDLGLATSCGACRNCACEILDDSLTRCAVPAGQASTARW